MTGVDFVLQAKSAANLSGAAVRTGPFLMALDANASKAIAGRVPGGAGTAALAPTGHVNNGNFFVGGFSSEAFAKNGAYHATTVGTTAVNVDLTNLATGATSQVGDTSFATVNKITFYNTGVADMTIAPGAANPSTAPKFTGTTPTIALPAGSMVTVEYPAGATIDATHKIVTVTPTAGGDLVVAVGGA